MGPSKLALEAKRKLSRGGKHDDLTEKEKAALKEYADQQNARASRIYWDSPQEMAQFQAVAKKAGVGRFSVWCVQQIRLAARGEKVDPKILDELRQEAARWRLEAEKERDKAEEYRQEARKMNEKYQEVADQLARLAVRVGNVLAEKEKKGGP